MMDNKILLELAKIAIKDSLNHTHSINSEILKKYPILLEKRAVFVTLNLNSNLRGCIGSLVAHRTLFDDIIHNAKSAAFNDPRFKPLSLEEFKKIDIEISILSPATLLEYEDIEDLKSKIRIGIDGVILKKEKNQATFLPSVWEQLPTFELFFEHLCKKARVEGNCLNNHPEIYIYQANKIK